MKNIFASTVIAVALAASTRAAEVKLTDVHLCCQSCVKGVQTATSKVQGLTATSDMDEGTVSFTRCFFFVLLNCWHKIQLR